MAASPNVLFILSDQHHAGLMGCAGNEQVHTPNLDRLAGMGLRFDRAYTQNPICTPSRVSFLSGQAPLNHGYYGLSGPTPTALPSVFGHFRAHGYRTAGIGKLHLPDDPRNWVADDLDDYGDCYRSMDGRPTQGPYWDDLDEHGLRETEDSRTLPETGRWSPDSRASNMPFEHCVEHWCVERTRAFIDQADDRPFFIHTSFPRPHHQLTPDRRFLDLYPGDIELPESFFLDGSHRPPHFRDKMRQLKEMAWEFEPKDLNSGLKRVWRGYLACISQVDWAVGQLLDHVEQSGLMEDTVIVYSSDHGAYHGLYGIAEKAPGICSEAVCRIPWIMAGAGIAARGETRSAFIQNSDLAPTLCTMTGIPVMESSDGCDQTPVLADPAASVRALAVTENPWSHAIRWDHWRYVHYPEELFGEDVGELYNLEEDPDETVNLFHSETHQPIVQEGRKQLLDWLLTARRPVTVNPSLPGRGLGNHHYKHAGDGKETRSTGVRERINGGRFDYL